MLLSIRGWLWAVRSRASLFSYRGRSAGRVRPAVPSIPARGIGYDCHAGIDYERVFV